MSVFWRAGLALVCEACGWSCDPGPRWNGCDICGEPLATTYPCGSPELPLERCLLTSIGQQPTPIVCAPQDPHTWLKLEYVNPTGSHKDRFHAITSAIARELAAPGVVTTSTGNHGVSCAAHAARDGLDCVVLATGELPDALAVQLAAYGASLARLDPGPRRATLEALVERGWVPATASDHALSGAANPYGPDGYRAIADEIVAELGCVPAAIAAPAASGDTVTGLRYGFDSVCRREEAPVPLVLACQPEGAASLTASIAAARQVRIDRPESIGRSVSDPSIGRLAIAAASRNLVAVNVSEDEIAHATIELARSGFYVESSSALAFAGLRRARADGWVEREALGVVLLTGTGRGWSERERWVREAIADAQRSDPLDGLQMPIDMSLTVMSARSGRVGRNDAKA